MILILLWAFETSALSIGWHARSVPEATVPEVLSFMVFSRVLLDVGIGSTPTAIVDGADLVTFVNAGDPGKVLANGR